MSKESLQEEQYKKLGDYHRKRLHIPFHPSRTIYNTALALLYSTDFNSYALDYGGGDGALATLMADKGTKVVVFDRDQLALSYAGKDKRLSLIQGETYLPFRSESFDGVTMIETLEHIPDAQEMDALKECNRVLKPNGYLVISVPSSNKPVSEKHYRHYNLGNLVEKLESARFDILETIHYKGLASWFDNKPSIARKPVKAIFYIFDWIINSSQGKVSLTKTDEKNAVGLVILAKKKLVESFEIY